MAEALKRIQRSDTDEVVEFPIAESMHAVQIDRRRSADHDHGVIHDICILTRGPGGGAVNVLEVPHEISRDFIQALIDARQMHAKWLREGTNWNLGADGV